MTKSTKPIPEGYRTLTSHVVVKDVNQAIEFYKRALGATEIYRMPTPDGKSVMHAEIKIGDSILMLGQEMEGYPNKSAQSLGGSPVGFYLYVTDADQSFKKAMEAGGKQTQDMADMFWGDRCGTLVDPFGLQWTIATHVEDLSPQEMEERGKEFFAKNNAA
ncbi:MAG: glyoxalase [Bdellovibrionales bacterium RIFOXYC1_FULL_54_43]|nr:MAG: glyoxalase [Bdellovibrionales bacterium RIFOXYC1_FULL_54_43]